MTTMAADDLDELVQGFRRLLADLPSHESYGRKDVASIIVDIERLKAGWRPSAEDLAAAARIDDWSVRGPQDQEILFGWISRHPWSRRRQLTNTAGIVLVDRNLRWVRTIGRFYEIGAPEESGHAETLLGLRIV